MTEKMELFVPRSTKSEPRLFKASSEFNKFAKTLPPLNSKIQNIIDNQENYDVDDPELQLYLNEIAEVKKKIKAIDEAKTTIRKAYDNFKNKEIQEIEEKLNEIGYDEIQKKMPIVEQIKKNKLAQRKQKNWNLVKEFFDKTVEEYGDSIKNAPKSIQFNTFMQRNPKTAGESKDFKMTPKNQKPVIDYLQNIKVGLDTIESLNSEFQAQLFSFFDDNNDIHATIDYSNKLIAQALQIQAIQKEKELKLQLQKEEEEKKALLIKQELEQKALMQQQTQVASIPFGAPPVVNTQPVSKTQKALSQINQPQPKEAREKLNAIYLLINKVSKRELEMSLKDLLEVIHDISKETNE